MFQLQKTTKFEWQDVQLLFVLLCSCDMAEMSSCCSSGPLYWTFCSLFRTFASRCWTTIHWAHKSSHSFSWTLKWCWHSESLFWAENTVYFVQSIYGASCLRVNQWSAPHQEVSLPVQVEDVSALGEDELHNLVLVDHVDCHVSCVQLRPH